MFDKTKHRSPQISLQEALNLWLDLAIQNGLLGGGLNINAGFEIVGAHLSNSSLGVAVNLMSGKPTNATKLLIQAVNANVRYRLDDADPTASVGFVLKPVDGEKIIFLSAGMGIRVIQESAGAEIQYQWLA